MEFEVKGKTDNWLQLKADGIGVGFVGKIIIIQDYLGNLIGLKVFVIIILFLKKN